MRFRGQGAVNPFHPLNVGQAAYAEELAGLIEQSRGRPAQGLSPSGTYTRGNVTYNPNYYAKLLASGQTKDPYTGHDIPGVALLKGAIDNTVNQLIPDDRPRTVTNPFVDGNAQPQPQDIPRAQPPDRFAATSASLEDMLLGQRSSPQSTDPRLVAAVQQQGVPEGQRHYGEAFDALVKANAYKAARDRIAMGAAMNQPGVMRRDVERMQAEYARKHPAYANDPPEPLSPRQQAEQERLVRLQEHRDSYEALGIPGHLITGLDEKGQPLGPTPTEYWAADTNRKKMEFEQVREERAYYKDVLSELQKAAPVAPDTALLDETAAKAAEAQFAAQQRIHDARVNEARSRAFGFNPGADAAVATPERVAPPGERGGPARTATAPSSSGVVRMKTADDIRNGLASGAWAVGTILVDPDGNIARVNDTGGLEEIP